MKKKKSKKKKKNKLVVDEQQFIEVLEKITKKLSYKFKFGYHEIEDMKQQAAIFAMEALDKYDHKRPLENFLWTHVRNRLFNYKRDNYQRPDKPCLTCPLYDPNFKKSSSGCTKFENKQDCDLYSNWQSRNDRKKNLMHFTYIGEDNDQQDGSNFLENISNQEIIDILENSLTYEYRELYLKLKNGEKIKSADINKLRNEIHRILDNEKNT
jgi:DNA-directed RNA polymerase specialized sigma24 family protein